MKIIIFDSRPAECRIINEFTIAPVPIIHEKIENQLLMTGIDPYFLLFAGTVLE